MRIIQQACMRDVIASHIAAQVAYHNISADQHPQIVVCAGTNAPKHTCALRCINRWSESNYLPVSAPTRMAQVRVWLCQLHFKGQGRKGSFSHSCSEHRPRLAWRICQPGSSGGGRAADVVVGGVCVEATQPEGAGHDRRRRLACSCSEAAHVLRTNADITPLDCRSFPGAGAYYVNQL